MSQRHKKQSTTDRGANFRHIKCNIYAYICVSVPYSSYPDCVYILEIMINILDVNLTLPRQHYIFPSFPTLCKSYTATPALHLCVGVSASKFLSRFDNLLGCCLGADAVLMFFSSAWLQLFHSFLGFSFFSSIWSLRICSFSSFSESNVLRILFDQFDAWESLVRLIP